MSRRRQEGPQDSTRDARANRVAATAVLALLAIAAYIAYAKPAPFTHRVEVNGIFTSANGLAPGNPVRIAGLDVGRVTSVERVDDHRVRVTMTIDGHPDLHTDARLAIKPRLAFEGNFYVQLLPGSASAPHLRPGATVPLANTSIPVQLDQVLDTLTAPVRGSLTSTVHEVARGLGADGGTGARAAGVDGLRRAADEMDGALVDIGTAAKAIQGTRPGDLARAVDGLGATTQQIGRDPVALSGLVTSYNRTFEALAQTSPALARTVTSLRDLTRTAPGRLARLDRALPPLVQLSQALRPALRQARSSAPKLTALVAQLGEVTRPHRLPLLLRRLEPVTHRLPGLEAEVTRLAPLVGDLGTCVSGHVVPALNKVVPDDKLTTKQPAWLELLHLFSSLAGTAASFDGNGTSIRLGVSEGAGALSAVLPGVGQVQAAGGPFDVNPTWLGYGVQPPFRPDQPCATQALPDLTARRDHGLPPGYRVIAEHRPDSATLNAVRQILEGHPERLLAPLLKQVQHKSSLLDPVRRPGHALGEKTAPVLGTTTGTGGAQPPAAGSESSSGLAPLADTIGQIIGTLSGGVLK